MEAEAAIKRRPMRRMHLEEGEEMPALSRGSSMSTQATDEDLIAIDGLDSWFASTSLGVAKDSSFLYDDDSAANAKKESECTDEGYTLVLESEEGALVLVDSPEAENESFFVSAPEQLHTIYPRRKALLIGCKYERNPDLVDGKTLKGPYNDVGEIKRLLQNVYDWDETSFRVMKDDGKIPEDQPTLDNIRAEIKNLVEGAKAGDQLFFYFSGHGAQVDDEDWDEVDGKDEALVTSDGKRLIDDELHEILVKPIPTACRLTAVLDCCASGTALDLPYNAFPQRQTAFPGPGKSIKRKFSDGNVVLLSATEDSARAYEKFVGGKRYTMGELTHAFIKIMKSGKRSTYSELLSSVRIHFERRRTMQNPQLSSSHEIDMNEYFDL